jgi:PAT family beta-lactamase induction signal transducer AmpG
MSAPERPASKSPWSFVPVLYFLQGVPSGVINEMSTAYFTQMGVGLQELGRWPALLRLPWTLKPLWSPFVDTRSTKRRWVIATQAAVSVGLLACAAGTSAERSIALALAAFAFIALASATHDIAADGFYILALDPKSQARFVGVRTLFFRLATLFCGGTLLQLAGRLQASGLSIALAWRIVFLCAALVFGICALVNAWAMPRPASDVPSRSDAPRSGATPSHSATHDDGARPRFVEVIGAYFRQPRLVSILAFILLYRLGESMISAFSTPFLLKPALEGGLGVSIEAVGWLKGTVGLAALTAGGLLGGVVISRYGIKRCFWPMVLAMNLPNGFYVWAAIEPPSRFFLGALIAVDQFGYGFGFSAYLVYLMFLSRGRPFPTAHYAISTGLMALSALSVSYFCGDIVASVGFRWFFVIVCLASVPGMLTLFFIPMEGEDLHTAPADGP